MKKELTKILDKIQDLYNDENVAMKQKELSDLWTRYYQLAFSYKIELQRAYDLYLLGENISYVVDAKISYQENLEIPVEIIKNLRKVIENNKKENDLSSGVSMEEAKIFLTWIINRTWQNLSYLGIDLSKNSLNGFCEIAQVTSIYPLEKLGLTVTKNTAEDSFGYCFHHAFGTVEIPILENGRVRNQSFLIDPTYKQFFTVVRCNLGRFYAKEENTGKIVAPDPGYFMKTEEEKEMSKQLIYNGYLPLTEKVAKIYGSGFQKASVSLENVSDYDQIRLFTGKDYIQKIKETAGDYAMPLEDFEGNYLELEIPNFKKHSKR